MLGRAWLAGRQSESLFDVLGSLDDTIRCSSGFVQFNQVEVLYFIVDIIVSLVDTESSPLAAWGINFQQRLRRRFLIASPTL